MMTPDLTKLVWRKATRSDSNGGACVEVADLTAGIAVRDSKDQQGPVLAFGADQWISFVGGIRAGRFDA